MNGHEQPPGISEQVLLDNGVYVLALADVNGEVWVAPLGTAHTDVHADPWLRLGALERTIARNHRAHPGREEPESVGQAARALIAAILATRRKGYGVKGGRR